MDKYIDNRYRVEKEIGKGGGGCVYLVYDEKLGKNWAMKEIKEIKDHYMREVETLKTVDYPAFPRIVDLLTTRTSYFLIMDYIDGLTLREYIQTCRVTEQDIREWGIQIALAFSYLHNLNPPIYYLGCKPDNILISPKNMVHIIDFGSTYVECKYDTLQRISGTCNYAPLEQKNPEINRHSISAQCDIYSLGITLFYALTKTEQVLRDRKERLLVRDFNPSVSYGMNNIIDKCTRISRKQRFHSMEEVLTGLRQLENITKKERKKHIGIMIWRIIERIIIAFVVLKFGQLFQQTKNMIYLFMLFISLAYIFYLVKERKHITYEVKKEIIRGEGKKFLYLLILFILSNQAFAMAGNKESKLNLVIKDSQNRNILIKDQAVWDVNEDIKLVIPFDELPDGENMIMVICRNHEDSQPKTYEFTYVKDPVKNRN